MATSKIRLNAAADLKPRVQAIPGRGKGIYFSGLRPLSDPANARDLTDTALLYMSAQRFNVFSCFSSQMSVKPAVIRESAGRIASAFADQPHVAIKELGAGYGESMAFLLDEIRTRHYGLYRKLIAHASDGYPQVVEKMGASESLEPFLAEGNLTVSSEDIRGRLSRQQKFDYIRLSYTLTDLPEDMIKKEGGRFFRAFVKGYLNGTQDFVTEKGIRIPATTITSLLAGNRLQEIIGLGLDSRDVQPRVGYEFEYLPIDFSAWKQGSLVRSILEKTTSGISDTNLRLGFNAARAIKNIFAAQLCPKRGSFMEIFDVWTASMLPGMPPPHRKAFFTSINSVNFPFVREYLRSRSIAADVRFEDWKKYIRLSEPYISCSQFRKRLEETGGIKKLAKARISAGDLKETITFLTHHTADVILYSEKASHPVIKLLKKKGFTAIEIESLFKSGAFPEPDKSQSHGYYGIYQVVTIKK